MQARFYDPQVGRFLSTDPMQFDGANPFTFNRYAYGNNNPYRYVDPDGNSPAALVGVLVEVAVQAYTGELSGAVSDAFNGDFRGVSVSAAKVGVAAVSGGVSTVLAAKGASLAVKGAEAVRAGAAATKVAEVSGVAAAQAANGAGSKVTTNLIEGKPVTDGVGVSAAVGATLGTAGKYAGSTTSDLLSGSVGAASANAAKAASQILTGVAKKEASCSASTGGPC